MNYFCQHSIAKSGVEVFSIDFFVYLDYDISFELGCKNLCLRHPETSGRKPSDCEKTTKSFCDME